MKWHHICSQISQLNETDPRRISVFSNNDRYMWHSSLNTRPLTSCTWYKKAKIESHESIGINSFINRGGPLTSLSFPRTYSDRCCWALPTPFAPAHQQRLLLPSSSSRRRNSTTKYAVSDQSRLVSLYSSCYYTSATTLIGVLRPCYCCCAIATIF